MDAVITPERKMSFTTWLKAIIALLGWFALILQLYLLVNNATINGTPLPTAIVNYFSFFTILTNIIVAIGFTAQVLKLGTFFSRPSIKAGITLYIAIVGIVYSLLLRAIWQPTGWQKAADMLLHDVIPVLAVLYWLIFEPKGKLKWVNALQWLIYPTCYLIYTLIRGVYPYPFIDMDKLGVQQAAVNIALLIIAFVVLGLCLVALDRLLAPRRGAL